MNQVSQVDFRIAAKTELLRRGMSITALAIKIDKPRPTVSKAINQLRFPKVLLLISNELGLHAKNTNGKQ